MNLRYVAVGLVLLLLLAVAAMNVQPLAERISLNLVFAEIEAPLAIILAVVVGSLVGIYQLVIFRVESLRVMESRRIGKELERVRELAAKAELSRFDELRRLIEIKTRDLEDKLDKVLDQIPQAPEPTDGDKKPGPIRSKIDSVVRKFERR